MKINIKKTKIQRISNLLFIGLITIVLLLSIFLYIYERHFDRGFHLPNIPLLFFVILWIYVVLQIVGVSMLNNSTYLRWIVLNISTIGVLLLFLVLIVINGFYTSDYFINFQFPVLSLMSVILLFKNSHSRKRNKYSNKKAILAYL